MPHLAHGGTKPAEQASPGAGTAPRGDAVRRIMFEWRGIKLYSYPVMLYVGLLSGVLAGTYGAGLYGLNPGRVYAAMLLLIPLALVGAKLLFLLAHWRLFRREPRRIWRQSEGEASLYGGLICVLSGLHPVTQNPDDPLRGFLGCHRGLS